VGASEEEGRKKVFRRIVTRENNSERTVAPRVQRRNRISCCWFCCLTGARVPKWRLLIVLALDIAKEGLGSFTQCCDGGSFHTLRGNRCCYPAVNCERTANGFTVCFQCPQAPERRVSRVLHFFFSSPNWEHWRADFSW